MAQTFAINDPPGAFRVFSSDGSSAFDSRLATQRIYMIGNADVGGRTITPAPDGGVILNPSASLNVSYGKTFAKTPYIRSVSRKIGVVSQYQYDADSIYPPYIQWLGSGDFYTCLNGHFTNANTASVYLGNADATAGSYVGTRRYWYAVFENPVDGS